MKKLIVINLCALLLIFFTAGVHAKPNTDMESISYLLEQRIIILNHFYGEKMSFDDARNNMAKITADGLLREDVSMMEALDDTEVDQVTDFDLEVISCERTSYGIVKGEVKIHWVLYGQSGYWETEESYYFTAEEDQEEIKLTQLKKL